MPSLRQALEDVNNQLSFSLGLQSSLHELQLEIEHLKHVSSGITPACTKQWYKFLNATQSTKRFKIYRTESTVDSFYDSVAPNGFVD